MLILCLSLIFPAFSALAQEQNLEGSSWKQEIWENFKSPITTDAKIPLLIGAGLATTILIFQEQISDPIQEEVAKNRPLGSFSRIGDLGGQGYPNVIYGLGMLGYGVLKADSEAKGNAFSMIQASLYSGLVTRTLKYTVRERRPDSSSIDSFPSGHATAAFAFASYVGCRHSLPWGIAAYSLATLVGFSRINDNRHYLQDVVAGAAIGGSYGLGVCLAENKRQGATASTVSTALNQGVRWFAAPTYRGVMAGFTMNY